MAGQDAVSTKLDWLATFRARAGITLADRLLVYVTGGLAVGQEQYAGTYAVVPNGVYYLAPNQSSTRAGWTIGGGGEWAFANNWSIKGEYLYYDLGSATSDVQSLQTNPMFHVVQNYTFNGHIVRIGVNYKFGGPVVAKY